MGVLSMPKFHHSIRRPFHRSAEMDHGIPDLTDPQTVLVPDAVRFSQQLGQFRRRVAPLGAISRGWYHLAAVAWVGVDLARPTELNLYGPGGDLAPALLLVGWSSPPREGQRCPTIRSTIVPVDPMFAGDPEGFPASDWRSLTDGLGTRENKYNNLHRPFDPIREASWLAGSLVLAYRLADYCLGRQPPGLTPGCPRLGVRIALPAEGALEGGNLSALYPADQLPVDLAGGAFSVGFSFIPGSIVKNTHRDHVTGLPTLADHLLGWGVIQHNVSNVDVCLSEYIRIRYAL